MAGRGPADGAVRRRAGTLLIAQSLGDVRNTVARLTLLFAVIGGGAVMLVAGLGYLVVRTSLRPLRDVERTAAAIATGDLSERVPTADPRTEIGQLSAALNTTPVDLLALADDAVQAARAVDPTHPVRLEVGPTDPPPVVTGDEPRLRQVLANLLGNAARHTPPGTPVTVRVTTEAGRTGDLAAVLTVADEGPGMAAEQAERVFERFYRADPARGRADGGTGLGLAIVAALVAGHGGTVEVDSAPGRGARFRVELPLAALPAPAGRTPSARLARRGTLSGKGLPPGATA